MKKKETFKCFVYREEVQLVDGVCQEDCSIEECNLNRDNEPGYKADKEETDFDESAGVLNAPWREIWP